MRLGAGTWEIEVGCESGKWKQKVETESGSKE